MRLNINLASQKYEDVRQFYVRWGAVLAVLAFLTVLLASLSYLKYSRSTAAARQTRDLQQRIASLEKQRSQLIEFENRPENLDVKQQKKYWNTQIAKRAFSWTQLLNEMQKIMPRRAFLESVQPELTPDNHLQLRLVINGEKQEDARELQVKMEDSPRFQGPKIVAENLQEAKPGIPPTWKFQIETLYTPSGPAPFAAPQNQRGQAGLLRPGARGGM